MLGPRFNKSRIKCHFSYFEGRITFNAQTKKLKETGLDERKTTGVSSFILIFS